MESSRVPDAPSVHGASSPQDSESRTGLEIRCPCCNAGIVLEDIALRVVQGPSPRRLLTLEVSDPSLGLEETVRDVRRQLIELALRQSRGVKARAAELVGLKYSTFWEMAERLGCDEIATDDPEAEDASPLTEVPLDRVERVVVLRRDPDGPPVEIGVAIAPHEPLLRKVSGDVKLALVRRVLAQAEGNVARAAELADMKYTTFHSFLNRLPEDALADGQQGG